MERRHDHPCGSEPLEDVPLRRGDGKYDRVSGHDRMLALRYVPEPCRTRGASSGPHRREERERSRRGNALSCV